MEGVMKQWKEEEEEVEVEGEGLVKRQAHYVQVSSTSTTATSKFEVQATEQTNGSSGLSGQENQFIQTEVDSGDNEKKTKLHPLDPVIHVDSTFFSTVRTESERVGIITENVQLENELYLESLYQKTPTQGFYCPNCRTCIQKVILLDTVKQEPSATTPLPPSPRTFRCSSCFSFLIPIGRLLFPGLIRDTEGSTIEGQSPETPQITVQAPETPQITVHDPKAPQITVQAPETPQITVQAHEKPQITVQTPDQLNTAANAGNINLQYEQEKNEGEHIVPNEEDHITRNRPNLSSEIPRGQDESKGKHPFWGLLFGTSALATLKRPEQPPQLEEVRVEGRTELPPRAAIITPTQPDVDPGSGRSNTWELLKSIVYGGLIESIASLGIVTSSASSDATTLNILVLSLANLIGGLFIIVHNIWDLKSEQPRRTNNETNTHVDQYYQVLGKREHFYLHVFIAILSFIIFGLVPPLVYAFTFNDEINNRDLKLAAVAAASAICITLLSLAKAYIQRPTTYLTYLKTVLYYLSTGAMTSVVSYLAGELVKELIKNLGWFDTKSSSFTLVFPEMSSEKPRFGSF